MAANVDDVCKIPDGLAPDPRAIQTYVERLAVVAECLAKDCGAPELWNRLTAVPNGYESLDQWYSTIDNRMERLEFEALIAESDKFLERIRRNQGSMAVYHEICVCGRRGQLLVHSGRVTEGIAPFERALELCRANLRTHGLEEFCSGGQKAYLHNLLETQRYLGNPAAAAALGDELAALGDPQAENADRLRRRNDLIRHGEPLCRVLCRWNDEEWELDEVPVNIDGRLPFYFRRNRPTLTKAMVLVEQGKALASSGNYADAMEKFSEAAEVDPYDPDPHYQTGQCLLDMGLYPKARESFEHVEQLAPGWFHCRSDIWMAGALQTGSVTVELYRMLRVLEDGGLNERDKHGMVTKALEADSEFAPFYQILGDLQRNQKKRAEAIETYRKGLSKAVEPHVESRLQIALAGLLPKGSPERQTLIASVLSQKGDLIAQATAVLLQRREKS